MAISMKEKGEVEGEIKLESCAYTNADFLARTHKIPRRNLGIKPIFLKSIIKN